MTSNHGYLYDGLGTASCKLISIETRSVSWPGYKRLLKCTFKSTKENSV